MIGTGIHDDQQPGFTESGLDLIGEGTRSETSGNRGGLGVRSELQGGTLAFGAAGDHEDISGVVDGDNSTSSQQQLLISAADVDDVDTWRSENWLVISISRQNSTAAGIIPSERRLKMYCSIWKSVLVEPMWVVAANILVTSSSLSAKFAEFPDIFASIEVTELDLRVTNTGLDVKPWTR